MSGKMELYDGDKWRAVTPADLGGGGGGVPDPSASEIVSAQTASTGTNWTAFGSLECNWLDLVNNTGTAIEFRLDGAGSAIEIPDGAAYTIPVGTNANRVSVKRADDSNTQVTVAAMAFS